MLTIAGGIVLGFIIICMLPVLIPLALMAVVFGGIAIAIFAVLPDMSPKVHANVVYAEPPPAGVMTPVRYMRPIAARVWIGAEKMSDMEFARKWFDMPKDTAGAQRRKGESFEDFWIRLGVTPLPN